MKKVFLPPPVRISIGPTLRWFCACLCMALLPGLGTTATAAPPDLTAGGLPADSDYWNLGPTGMQGWFYHVGSSTAESRQILVAVVGAGSPADGILAVNDVILGANGTGDEPVEFTYDARRALADAINAAEARNPAALKLLRWRTGITTTVTVTLETLGAYSATAPYNCPKSAAILEKGVARIMQTGETGGYMFSTMTLLAANDPLNPANAARQAKAATEARSLNLTAAQIAEYTSNKSAYLVSKPWSIGHQLMMQAEYYLQTGDVTVLPSIRARAILAAKGQSMFGTTGHQFAKPGAYGEINGSYGVGYGTVNNANMGCFTGLVLAQKCGLNDPEILAGIERASRFYGAYVNRGSIPYGEHQPGGGHESNGKCGQAALAFLLKGDRPEAATFYAQMATASGTNRDAGHTGPYFNYQWAPLGANAGGEEAMAVYFSRARWMYDLARRWDGGFEYNTYGQGSNRGSEWQNFPMSTAILLTYAVPLRQTYITGKNQNPAQWLSQADAEAAANAADYVASSRSTNQLLADLGSWSPPNRRAAAKEIGLRTSEHATLLPTLHAMATSDPNVRARMGACFALGEIAHDNSCPIIADLLDDPENLVRWASAVVISNFSQTAKMAQLNVMLAACASTAKPLLPLDPEDPIHLAHAFLVPSIFGNGGAGAPRGVLYNHNLVGVDRSLLYPALRAAAATPQGMARSTISVIYPFLSKTDIDAIAGSVVDATMYEAPADRMFADSARFGGLDVLKSHNISEGVPLSVIVAKETDAGYGLGVLQQYAKSCLSVKPDPKVVEFCNFLIASGSSVTEAQAVLNAIAADQLPDKVTSFKSIDWNFPDNASFNLPKKSTVLRVQATDHAQGDSKYTWRKVHGSGDVTFTPNGSASAKNTTVVFDGVPGVYQFEVTMSDSRGLTEVSKTVSVTLRDSSGNLPSNSAPTANPQSVVTTQGTPTQIILTGSDPEGYALNYAVTGQPANGTLSGTAPHLVYTAKANYAGADSFTFQVMDSGGLLSNATVSITVDPLASVGLAVYEPFQYPAGALNGATGGIAAVGLSGSWSAGSGINLVAQSLPFGTLKTAGGSVGNLVSGNGFGGRRALNAAALAGNGLLDDGATLWFSMEVGHTGNNYLQKLYVALANNQFSTATNNYSIVNDGALLGSGVGITLDGSTALATQFRDSSFGTSAAAHVFGNWSGHQGSVLSSRHRLVVGRITWGAASDKIDVFLPYDDMLLPSVPSSSLTVNANQSTFDTLTFARSGVPLLDEIRFGATYQSVLQGTAAMTEDLTAPTPNPMSFAVAPKPSGPSSITMTAATAHDAMAVEYYFTCTAGGGSDSGWQSGNTYTATGLTPGVIYSYTVKARDKHPGLNETAASAPASAMIPVLGTVPDVVGMPQATAEALLTNAYFTVGTVTTATGYSLTVPAGNVLSQTPVGAGAAAYGSAVNLVISIGADSALPTLDAADIVDDRGGNPVDINVPVTFAVSFSEDMNEATVGAADFTNAENAAITFGAITEITPGVFTVVVTPTSPGILRFAVAAGAALQDAQGDALNTSTAIIDETVITVNLSPVTVPNVANLTQAAAQSAITAANLVVGVIYQIYSESVAAGNVISQSPDSGSSIPGQSKIDLVISKGPPPDTTGPVIATIDPADGSNHIEVTDKLVVYFNENVVAGTGNITIRNLSDYTEFTIPVSDTSQVFISGVVMTIDPAADLLAGKSYAVRIAPGAVRDLSGNPFNGINDNAGWNFSTSLTPNETVLFTESFESPDVTAYTQGSAPTRWVKALQGYGASRHGLTDKAGGNFSAADPNHQGYAFRYTNTGLTTAEGVIGTVTAGSTYRVEFDVIRDAATAGTAYSLKLMAFNPGAVRDDARSDSPGWALASATGNGTTNGSFSTKFFDFTVPTGSSHIGNDIAVRLIGSGSSAIIDNVVVKTITPNLPDMLPPVVTSFTPEDNATSFPVTDNLVLTFNENISKGAGNITIKNLTDDTQTQISVLSGQVIVTGATLTINPAVDLLVDKFYSVRIPTNALYDQAGNSFEGIDNDTRWSFVTGEINDTTAPSVVSLSPSDGATGVPYGSNLSLTFNESVVAGAGSIILKNLTDSTQLAIDVTDETQVSFHGAVVTINPAVYLAEGKDYAVRIDAGAIVDLPGNAFAGLIDDTTWNFTTSAINPPTLVAFNPPDESVGVDPGASFILTFDENTAIGTGNITIKNLSDASQWVINVTDSSQVSVSGPMLTIDPVDNLTPGKNFAVLVGAGAVSDLQGNPFAGITNEATWNFISGVSSEGLVFRDDFEVASGSPNVDATGSLGDTSGLTGPKWVRASVGFGSGRHGLVDESSGQFTDPTGEQAYAFRYTNSGITTQPGRIGALAPGYLYTVSFYVVKDGYNGGGGYNVGLVSFAPGASRIDCTAVGTNASKVLAQVSGTYTSTNYKLITFQFTSNAVSDAAVLGHDLAVRIRGSSSSAIIDNVQVTVTGAGGADAVAPTLAPVDIVDNRAGGTIYANTPVVYTLTFSEDMDASTVSAADFGNAGSAAISFGAISETSPGIFTVSVTPTSVGTLQLQVKAGALLRDISGNALNTTTDILDDTTITVNVNATPVWVNDPVIGVDSSEDAAYVGTLGNDASDADNHPLVFAKVSGPAWLNIAANGALTGTPSQADVGANVFTVSVTDSIASPVQVSLNITVLATNDAPVFVANPIQGDDATEDAAYSGTIAGSAVDLDPDAVLTYAKVSGPAWLNVAPSGVISGLPSNSEVGANSFTVSVSDGISAPVVATLNITVLNINDAPTWSANPITGANATVNIVYSGTLATFASDVDAGAILTFAKVSGPEWLSVAADGTLTGSPANSNVGTNSFAVSVSDGAAPTVEVVFNVTVVAFTGLTWDADGATGGQTNGAGAWLGNNLWWNGASNTTWVSGSNAVFGGPSTAGGAVTLASPTSAGIIVFNTYTGTYTLGSSGKTITLGGGVSKNAGSAAAVILSPVVLGASQIWSNNASGTSSLSLGTGASNGAPLNNNGHLLTIDGSGSTFLKWAAISGSGGLTKNGTGYLEIGGQYTDMTHTYTGTTTINGGSMRVVGDGSTGNLGSGNLILNGGVLEYYYNGSFIRTLGPDAGQVQILGGASGFGCGNSVTFTLNNSASYETVWGSQYFNPSTFVLNATTSAGTTTFANKIDLNGATRTIRVNAGTGRITGVIRTASGTAGLVKTGNGGLELNAANTYNGGTTLQAGTLQLGNATALGSASGALTVNGGLLNLNNYSASVGNLTGTGGTIANNGANARTLTIGSGDGTGGDFQGVIANNTNAGTSTLALTKTGAGSITLSGASTYTGATVVSVGKLFINGSTADSAISVSSGATLGGTGSIGGDVTIANNGKLEFDINVPADNHDPLDIASGKTFTFSGASELTITSNGGLASGTYTLITGGNNITGLVPAIVNVPAGWLGTVSISGNSLLLNVTAPLDHFEIASIPSPHTGGMPITGITITAKDAAGATVVGFTGTVAFGGTAGITGTSANFVNGVLAGLSITPVIKGNELTLTVDDGAGHTGSATFTVISIYDNWAVRPFTSIFSNTDPAADPDGDGIKNLQEFAFGMDPTVGGAGPLAYVAGGAVTNPGTPVARNLATGEGVDFRAIFTRRKDYVAAGLTYRVQFSADLINWVNSSDTPTVLTGSGSANPSDVEAVSVPYPFFVPVEGGHKKPNFFQVVIESP